MTHNRTAYLTSEYISNQKVINAVSKGDHFSYLWVVVLVFIGLTSSGTAQGQEIPSDHVLAVSELPKYLKTEVLEGLSLGEGSEQQELAAYFRARFSERYFYDWRTFDDRFELYNELYKPQSGHLSRAEDHMAKYADSTQWILPFDYLYGDPVNAYAIRHLARQHKMVDIAFQYYYDGRDPRYIDYFVNQMKSLNAALAVDAYEQIEDGNGVYEVFRSGYRILNWLRIHNMFLGQEAYSDVDQLTTIATLLQHGQDLYEQNANFRSGNHQTRGMSALAMLAILFSDFNGADAWYERSMQRLQEHLTKEINADGFQFERSVHYHISDIGNYFYVYQLAQISGIEVDQKWEDRLRSLFVTLAKIAYPNKTAPVLQDDTNEPWAEFNLISGTMTLGYLLFDDAEFGYFAEEVVDKGMYWFLNGNQLETLQQIATQPPTYSSLAFDQTGYYIMREGWRKDDNYLIISAGLDTDKPDHQHGDMLGIQGMANGQVILPNYQVRYSLTDYDFFKNSMVKNVALVDDEVQGKEWTGNKGGSGFGKFLNLPNPKVILWESDKKKDVFVGTHDGFENVGVSYTRQVIYVKDRFWIVKDNFSSNNPHAYKQVWQGHYSQDAPQLLRSTFATGAGLDIWQLKESDQMTAGGTQGKQRSVVVKEDAANFSFLTLIRPFAAFDKRVDEVTASSTIDGWQLNDSDMITKKTNSYSLTKGEKGYLFNISGFESDQLQVDFSTTTDVYYEFDESKLVFQLIADASVGAIVSGGKNIKLNGVAVKKKATLKPGDKLEIIRK